MLNTFQLINLLAVIFWLLILLDIVSVASTATHQTTVAIRKSGKVKSPIHETFAYLALIFLWTRHFIPYRCAPEIGRLCINLKRNGITAGIGAMGAETKNQAGSIPGCSQNYIL